MFLPFTSKYTNIFLKKIIIVSNLKEQKVGGGLETRQTWTYENVCHVLRRLWVVIKKSSILKKVTKINHVVKGAYVPFVEAFPLGTTMVTKKDDFISPWITNDIFTKKDPF